MAVTFAKESPAVGAPHDGTLSYASRDLPEAATQIFDAGSPTILVGGYVESAADPVTAIHGVALKPAGNGAADGDETSKIVEMSPRDREMIVTLLGVAGVDYVVDGTEPGLEIGLGIEVIPSGAGTKSAYVGVIGGTGFEITTVHGDQTPPGRTDSRAEIGDTNPRVTIVPNADILSTNS